jgi:hypothetical protein
VLPDGRREARIVQHFWPFGGNALGIYQGSASGMKMSKGQIGRRMLGLAVAGMALVAGGTAFAELGQPAPWEWTLQESASPVMDYIIWFHNWLFVTITLITLFVLGLLIAGQRNREIARNLSISENTVKFHVAKIFRKLGVGSRAEATAFVLAHRPGG